MDILSKIEKIGIVIAMTLAIIVVIANFCSVSRHADDRLEARVDFSEVGCGFSSSCKNQLMTVVVSAQIHAYKTLLHEWACNQQQMSELTEEQRVINYIYEICEQYDNVDPELVQSIVYYESRYVPEAKNYDGTCVGLMQLSTKWHTERALSLTGSANLLDPYVNLLTGIDLLSDMISQHGEENLDLVLMLYNGSGNSSYTRHKTGNPTQYVIDVLSMKEELENGTA